MAIFYDEGNAKISGKPFRYWDYNANAMWAFHRYNEYILTHIARKSDDFAERAQARKELEICERKQAFAVKHAGFDPDIAASYLSSRYGMTDAALRRMDREREAA